jgi:predicted RNase H-like HicB family nuclease
MKTVDDDIDLPYQVEMELEQLPNGQWVYFARHPDLPDAMGHGDTPEDPVRSLRSARRDVLSAFLEGGEQVPLPAVMQTA